MSCSLPSKDVPTMALYAHTLHRVSLPVSPAAHAEMSRRSFSAHACRRMVTRLACISLSLHVLPL